MFRYRKCIIRAVVHFVICFLFFWNYIYFVGNVIIRRRSDHQHIFQEGGKLIKFILRHLRISKKSQAHVVGGKAEDFALTSLIINCWLVNKETQ